MRRAGQRDARGLVRTGEVDEHERVPAQVCDRDATRGARAAALERPSRPAGEGDVQPDDRDERQRRSRGAIRGCERPRPPHPAQAESSSWPSSSRASCSRSRASRSQAALRSELGHPQARREPARALERVVEPHREVADDVGGAGGCGVGEVAVLLEDRDVGVASLVQQHPLGLDLAARPFDPGLAMQQTGTPQRARATHLVAGTRKLQRQHARVRRARAAEVRKAERVTAGLCGEERCALLLRDRLEVVGVRRKAAAWADDQRVEAGVDRPVRDPEVRVAADRPHRARARAQVPKARPRHRAGRLVDEERLLVVLVDGQPHQLCILDARWLVRLRVTRGRGRRRE